MFRYLKALVVKGIPILWAYFTWMKRYSRHPERYPISLRYKKLTKLIRSVSKYLDVDFHVEGKENLLSQTSYIVSNHLSNFDPLAFLCVLDQPTSFVSKIEVEKMPFVGLCVKLLSGLFIDREDIKQSLHVMMALREDLEQGNKNWIIFPEGTRNRDKMGHCYEFHHGTFKAAMKSGVPIQPAAIFGSSRILTPHPLYHKYPVFIQFLKPIMPEEYANLSTKDVAQMVQKRIQQAVSFHLKRLDHEYMLKVNKKKYRFNDVD